MNHQERQELIDLVQQDCRQVICLQSIKFEMQAFDCKAILICALGYFSWKEGKHVLK